MHRLVVDVVIANERYRVVDKLLPLKSDSTDLKNKNTKPTTE